MFKLAKIYRNRVVEKRKAIQDKKLDFCFQQRASEDAMDADVVFHPTSALASTDSTDCSVNNAFLVPDVFMAVV